MPESAGRDARAEAARLMALGASGVALGLCLIGFNLLYLSVPSGWTPPYGFAPDIAAAFAPRWPLPRIDVTPAVFRALAASLLAGMWAAFLLALRLGAELGAQASARGRAQRIVAALAGLIGVALILSPPTLSKDLYHYAVFGKMLVARGLNPYVTPIDALAGDPFWALANWRELSTHYGPVFTGLSALAVLAGGGGVVGTALAFKTLATVFGGMMAWAAFKLAERDGRNGLVTLLLVAWNPLVLLETAGSGHNEAVMLGLALVGLHLARRGRASVYVGFALTVISVHVKWVTAALAALMATARLREGDGVAARARELARLLAIAALATVALYGPFWAGRDSLGSTRELIAGAQGLRSGTAGTPSHLWNVLAFAAVAVGAAAVVWRGGSSRVLEMAAAVSLAFVVFVFPWLFPWYLVPALVLLAVGPPTRSNRGLLAATLLLAALLMARWAILVPGRSA